MARNSPRRWPYKSKDSPYIWGISPTDLTVDVTSYYGRGRRTWTLGTRFWSGSIGDL